MKKIYSFDKGWKFIKEDDKRTNNFPFSGIRIPDFY